VDQLPADNGVSGAVNSSAIVRPLVSVSSVRVSLTVSTKHATLAGAWDLCSATDIETDVNTARGKAIDLGGPWGAMGKHERAAEGGRQACPTWLYNALQGKTRSSPFLRVSAI
jgi:hypothetical protein